MFRLRIFFLILWLGLISFQGNSFSFNSDFNKAEDSLSFYLSKIVITESYSEKLEINKKFHNLFFTTLSNPESIDFSFDKLKNIGIVTNQSRTVRVITWNIPQPAGKQIYFGFIQHRTSEGNKVYELNDSRQTITNPQMDMTNASKWYGALYYQLIEQTTGSRKLYTLLGVEMNNIFSTRRVIECFWFDEKGQIIFGAPVFRIKNQVINRVIFEYSARVSMVLRYQTDAVMIVFDHLSPMRPEYVGNYQFYGPDFSYDAFRFENGFWEYIADIDVRNPKRERPAPIEAPEKNLEPGFLYIPNTIKATSNDKK